MNNGNGARGAPIPMPPNGITATQSYSWVLREIFLSTLSGLPFFAPFSFRRTSMLPIQTQDLPVLGAYILGDDMVPDGDANTGEIRFTDTFRIGFQGMILNNDPDDSEQKLDSIYWAICNGLFTNESITNKLTTKTWHHPYGTPDDTRFEGITRGARRHRFGNVGHNNETPVAELQFDVSVQHRMNFPVPVTDHLLILHLQTEFPVGGAPDQAPPDVSGQAVGLLLGLVHPPSPPPVDGEEIQQVTVEYRFTAPTVRAISPSSGPQSGGTKVTITGTDFVAVTAVMFGSSSALFRSDSDTQLTATAPSGTGTVDVTVTTAAAGTSATSTADRFTYQ